MILSKTLNESAEKRPSAISLLDVSILIVTWNSESWIARCLESLAAACESLRCEIVLFDNASSDRTLEVARSIRLPQLTILTSERNLGFAGGVNRARIAARGPFLFLLNPDCELAPRSVHTLLEYLGKHPEVAAAVPLLLDEGGAPQREFQLRRLPTLVSLVMENLLLDKIFPENRVSSSYRYKDLDISRPQPVEQPAAAAMVIRSEVAWSIGDLDEQFAPAWFEDVDYCRRLRGAGAQIHLVPEATAVHHRGSSLERLGHARFVEIWYENLDRYARKWMSRGDAEIVRWSIIAGMILRIAAVVCGLDPVRLGRREAIGVYRRVLRQAFRVMSDE